jgi:hypothetical protein
MDREELSPEIMTDFQGKLQQQLQQRTKLNFSIGETIYGFDSGQHMFTDDGDGQGRLIPGKLYKYKKLSPMVPSISYLKAILIGMDHPGRRETLLALKNLYKVLDELVKETPWQLKQKGTSYQGQVKELTKGNYYLSDPINSFGTICELYHREKIHGQALVTTLALLRHEADNGGFPASLQVLLASNYIERLPIDPYSGSALVYKRQADNFTLYSLGANFTDNGGTPSLWGEEHEGEDEVFWPVE